MEALSAVLPSAVVSQVGGAQTGEWVAELLGGAGAVVDGGMGPVWRPQGSQPVPTITGARILRTPITAGTRILTTRIGVIRTITGRTTATTDWVSGR